MIEQHAYKLLSCFHIKLNVFILEIDRKILGAICLIFYVFGEKVEFLEQGFRDYLFINIYLNLSVVKTNCFLNFEKP